MTPWPGDNRLDKPPSTPFEPHKQYCLSCRGYSTAKLTCPPSFPCGHASYPLAARGSRPLLFSPSTPMVRCEGRAVQLQFTSGRSHRHRGPAIAIATASCSAVNVQPLVFRNRPDASHRRRRRRRKRRRKRKRRQKRRRRRAFQLRDERVRAAGGITRPPARAREGQGARRLGKRRRSPCREAAAAWRKGGGEGGREGGRGIVCS
ncbi:hypothetical protein C8Q78DRAFT_275907 [Trametes maxima]|nr:hypothetical protein C8Q78DRAFT_275907 [Trametes maxima]